MKLFPNSLSTDLTLPSSSLGMEHDGPSDANDCDADGHIMSASLGAGKSTFSRCSSRYLRSFLRTSQASCLFERAAMVSISKSGCLEFSIEQTFGQNASAITDQPSPPSAVHALDSNADHAPDLLSSDQPSTLINAVHSKQVDATGDDDAKGPDLLGSWQGRHQLPGQIYGLGDQCALRFGRFATPLASK